MPEQILLQGKILGTEEFLLAGPAEGRSVRSAGEDLLAGKSQWTKRDKTSGAFMANKKSKKKFKGVRREKVA